MINYRAFKNIEDLGNKLKNNGVTIILDSIEAYDYGKFFTLWIRKAIDRTLGSSVDKHSH